MPQRDLSEHTRMLYYFLMLTWKIITHRHRFFRFSVSLIARKTSVGWGSQVLLHNGVPLSVQLNIFFHSTPFLHFENQGLVSRLSFVLFLCPSFCTLMPSEVLGPVSLCTAIEKSWISQQASVHLPCGMAWLAVSSGTGEEGPWWPVSQMVMFILGSGSEGFEEPGVVYKGDIEHTLIQGSQKSLPPLQRCDSDLGWVNVIRSVLETY